MRIVVISDSHRKYNIVERILRDQPTAHHVFFLGDVLTDIERVRGRFPDRDFHIVAGNCDFMDMTPNFGIEKIDGVGIFYTHGHTVGVKGGTGVLLARAKAAGCKIALYGHTHIARTQYEDGVYLVNPGSCACSREGKNSYAVIDIEKTGILPIIIEI